jgi:serine/threonine protein kinase
VSANGGASRNDAEPSGMDELPTVQESGRPLPPEVLPRYGRYQLLERIGRGGMAEVFLAVMEGAQGFRRRCVVKRIRPDKARSSYYTQMFVDEARITAALHHPNIVQVYEFGEIGDLLFLTMEYLDGKNLATVLDSLQIRDRLMRPALAGHVIQQVALGLHHAHTARDEDGRPLGVIHRDMSPTNVMLMRTGEVKILDFGVAKADAGLKQGATTVGRVKGKLPYMSPEQHSGRPLDARADLFSVGVMFWEMLTGEILLSEASGRERSRRVMAGEAPPPSELRPEVPPALDAIVLRCLHPMPHGRFPSAAALAEAVAEAVGTDRFDAAELSHLVEQVSGDPDPPLGSASASASSASADHPPRELSADSEGITLRTKRPPVALRPREVAPLAVPVQPAESPAAEAVGHLRSGTDVLPRKARRPSGRVLMVAGGVGLALVALIWTQTRRSPPPPSPPSPATSAAAMAEPTAAPPAEPAPAPPSPRPVATAAPAEPEVVGPVAPPPRVKGAPARPNRRGGSRATSRRGGGKSSASSQRKPPRSAAPPRNVAAPPPVRPHPERLVSPF